MCKCLRCGKELKSEASQKRGYGPTCHKIVSFQKNKKWKLALRKGLNTIKYRKKREIIIQNIINTPEVKNIINDDVAKEILDRVRKLELDNSYLKARVQSGIMGPTNATPHDTNLERIKHEESEKLTDPALRELRNVFSDCVNDLKEVLSQHGEDKPVLEKDFRFSNEELGIKIVKVEDLKIVRE